MIITAFTLSPSLPAYVTKRREEWYREESVTGFCCCCCFAEFGPAGFIEIRETANSPTVPEYYVAPGPVCRAAAFIGMICSITSAPNKQTKTTKTSGKQQQWPSSNRVSRERERERGGAILMDHGDPVRYSWRHRFMCLIKILISNLF